MRWCGFLWVWIVGAASLCADDLDMTIRMTIQRGSLYLEGALDEIEQQNEGHEGGLEALVLFTLLHCGAVPQDPAVKRLEAIVTAQASRQDFNYTIAYSVLALTTLDANRHRALVQACLDRLCRAQRTESPGAGAYGYRVPPPAVLENEEDGEGDAPAFEVSSWDNCNTLTAILALRLALDLDFEVDPRVFERVVDYYVEVQGRDGGFGYSETDRPESSLSMTAGSLAALAMATEVLEPTPENRERRERAAIALKKGGRRVEALLRFPPRTTAWPYFAAYAVERYGHFNAEDEIGGKDWYRVAARWIVSGQSQDGSFGDSSPFGNRGGLGAGGVVGPGTYGGAGKKNRLRGAQPGTGGIPRTCFALLTLARVSRIHESQHGDVRRLLQGCEPDAGDAERIQRRVLAYAGRALSPLIETLRVREEDMKVFADECLRRISGKDMGFSRARSDGERREVLNRWIAYYMEQRKKEHSGS